jgi:hypothetical protein
VSAALGLDSDKYMPRREVSTIGSTGIDERQSPQVPGPNRTGCVASRWWRGGRLRPTESTSFVQRPYCSRVGPSFVGGVGRCLFNSSSCSIRDSKSVISEKLQRRSGHWDEKQTDEGAGIGATYFVTLVRSRPVGRYFVPQRLACVRGRRSAFSYLYVT